MPKRIISLDKIGTGSAAKEPSCQSKTQVQVNSYKYVELIKLHNSQALHESTRWMKHPWLKVAGRNKYIKIREKKVPPKYNSNST